MARKRGGLAGIYDRNKKVIKTLAPIAAGFIPGVGPLIGAGIGAAMGGDREGKGYFKGFNTKGAALGGLSGYGGAKLGQAAKGGLAKMFTASPVDKLTGAPKMGMMTQTTGPTGAVQSLGGAPSVGLTAGGPSSYGAMGSLQPTLAGAAPSRIPTDPSRFNLGSLFGKEGMIEQNKTLLSGVGKGIMGIRNDALDQQAADATLNQRKYEFDKTYGLDAAQEADRKRREEDLMAQRAAFRAMFTGMA
jgi:hypothetical protein